MIAKLLVALLIAVVVVGVDLLFFRHLFWERLLANIAIVLAIAIVYVVFIGRG